MKWAHQSLTAFQNSKKMRRNFIFVLFFLPSSDSLPILYNHLTFSFLLHLSHNPYVTRFPDPTPHSLFPQCHYHDHPHGQRLS